MKLTSKLTVSFLLLAIIPIIIVGFIAFYTGQHTIRRVTIKHLISNNLLKSNELDRWISDNKKSIEDLAQRPLVKKYSSLLVNYQPEDPIYQEARESLIGDHFRPRLKAGHFSSFSILDPVTGLVLASDRDESEGRYRDNESFFLVGREKTVVQGVYYAIWLEQPAMTIGTPVRDDKGHTIAVLAGYMDLSELSEIMTYNVELSESEDTYLVNNFNFFVSEPRFGQSYALKKTTHTEGVQAGLSGREGVGFYPDYRGVPVIGAFKWLPDYNMCILTEMDQAEAYQPIIHLRRLIMLSALFIVLAVLAMSWLFSRSLIRPLKRLLRGTKEIGRGHLDYTVATTADDEIGALSRAFDQMSRQLKKTTISRDELSQHVRNRTAQLETVNQELEAFAYSVSHDLRAPLRAMDGFSTALLSNYTAQLDDQGRHYLNRIQAASQRMGNLIDDILSLSRVTRREMVTGKVDLSVVVRTILDDWVNENPDRKIKTIVADSIWVEGDLHLLRIAMENLIQNALKFSNSRDESFVEFGVRKSADESIFFVRDNGVGFDMAYAEKLFSPFQRLHAMNEFPGTGIGLVTVKRIITRHGGRIWPEAAIDQGATFFFTLGGNHDGQSDSIGRG